PTLFPAAIPPPRLRLFQMRYALCELERTSPPPPAGVGEEHKSALESPQKVRPFEAGWLAPSDRDPDPNLSKSSAGVHGDTLESDHPAKTTSGATLHTFSDSQCTASPMLCRLRGSCKSPSRYLHNPE